MPMSTSRGTTMSWRGLRRATAGSTLVAMAATLGVTFLAAPAYADTQTVTNASAMAVPAGGLGAPDHSASSVYPSPVTVSGLTGTTTKVTVKLNGLSHANVRDVDLLLVGPAGQKMVVMSDVGGNENVTNISPTFDDAAAGAAPDTGLGSGTYKPTNLSNGFTGDLWPAPAPAAPYGTSFAVFNGTNPNGTWNLYLADDASGDIGSLSGGWTLSVETGVATFPGVIQLSSVEYRGTEGVGVATVTIDRVSGDDGAVGVSFATGTGSATAGVDYTPVSTTVSFADGQTSRTVDVPITNDASFEGIDELIPISLSLPTGGATLGTPTSGQIRLQDNDTPWNTFPITIPATGPTLGASSPYPSNIVVAGASGTVTDVRVSFNGISHTHIRDLDMLLVAPNGTTTMLMQDVGPNTAVSGINLIFRDDGAGQISQTALVSGIYKPSAFDDGIPEALPAPAPAGPWGTTLAALDGSSPNGTWSLFVVDDAGGDVGQIDGGWFLSLTTSTASAGGPYTTNEGSGITLSGSTTADVPGATYEWDVDGDGQYDDATGQNPTVSAGTLASIGLGDGPDSSSVRVRATSGSIVITSNATTLTITNVAALATFSNNGPVTLGNSANVAFSGQTDPSSIDTTAGFRYSYDLDDDGDWEVGDGTYAGSTNAPSATVPAFVLNTVGDHEVNGRILDKDGGHTTYTTTIVVNPPPNVIPIADAGPAQDVNAGRTVTLDGTGSTDADDDPLTFSWVQTAGPAVTLTGANTAQPTFTAPTGPATLTFELSVDDGVSGPDTDTVTITVNGIPTADAGPHQDVNAGGTVTLDGTGSSDPDSDSLSYSWVQTAGPAVTLTGANTAQPTFTAPTGPATLTFELTVNDGNGETDTDTVTITVNAPPNAQAGPDQTVAPGDTVTLDGSGSTDPELGSLDYAWVQTSGPAVVLTGAGTTQPSFTAPATGVLTFELTVIDDGGSDDIDTVTIKVNSGPTADAGADQLVNLGDSVTLDGTASSDLDGDQLTYSWMQTGGGTVVTLTGPGTAQPTFTAPEGPDTLAFEVTVTDDDGLTDTDTVIITVNGAPTANAGPDQDVDPADNVTLDGNSSGDPNGDALDFSWIQTAGPAVTLTGANTSQPSFTAPAAPGSVLTFELTVNDGRGRTDTDEVSINVNGVPVADAGPNQDSNAGDTVTLDGTGSTDPDGDALSYSWTQTAGPAMTLTGATTATATFIAPTGPATLTFELTVNDGRGGSDTDVVAITVNAPPVADAGDDQGVAAAAAVTLDGADSTDPDGDALTFGWTQTGGTPVALTGATTDTPSFTAPAGGATLTFELTVNDGRGGSDSDTVVVTVDATSPSVTLSTTAGNPVNGSIPVTIEFSETVTGFTLGDVDATNATVTDFAGSGSTYTVTVVPGSNGTVSASVAAGAATDVAGNASTVSNVLTRTYDATRPTVGLTAPSGPVSGAFPVSGIFSEPVDGLAIGELSLAGCTASGLNVSGTGFSVQLTPAGPDTCSVSLPAGVVTDEAGNTNVASAVLSRVVDLTPPALPVLLVTRDDRCYSNGSAALGLRVRSGTSTTFSLGSSNSRVLPESRMGLTGLGDGDQVVRLELEPDGLESGVARVALTATNADGTSRIVIRVVVGANGTDRLEGSRLTDVILGLRGADVADGRGGRDLLCGGAGPDRLRGGASADVIHGQKGDDFLDGGPGMDVLVGGPGVDSLDGGAGTNNLVPRRLLSSLF